MIGANGSLAKGWVVVSGDHIVEVRVTKPSGVPAIATGGVILPGLIDLHGHPEYNVFSAGSRPRPSSTAVSGAAARSTWPWSRSRGAS